MEEHFEVYNKGTGTPYRIQVNKMWIEGGKIYFNLVDWSSMYGLPTKVFEKVEEKIYRCDPAHINGSILYRSDVTKAKEAEVKEFKERSEALEDMEDITHEDLIKEIKDTVKEMKGSLENLLDAGRKNLKQKGIRPFTFYTARFKEEIYKLIVPGEATQIKLINLSQNLTNFFNAVKFIEKKASEFSMLVRSEYTELSFLTQKLEKYHKVLKNKMSR
jgi:hypothetical protein